MNDKDAIQSKSQLVDFFRQKEKKKNDWLIGTEHEKFLFSLDDFKPIPYEGENGIEKLLKMLHENSGWSPIFEKNNIIGLLADNKSSISLEPGGQLELSGAALKNLHMTLSLIHI